MVKKTKYKHIEFEWVAGQEQRKTWRCVNIKGGYPLGIVSWYSAWKQYCYFPVASTVYSQDCLEDIIDFMKNL